MKKFRVYLTKNEVSTKVVEIEARNKHEAERQADEEATTDGWTRESDKDTVEAEAERLNPPYDTVDFPAYALTALIDGDFSGMSTRDSLYLRNWQQEVETRIRAEHGEACDIIYSPGEQTYFSTAQVFGLPAECVELEIHVIGGTNG